MSDMILFEDAKVELEHKQVWVAPDRTGHFSERSARYHACTHVKCDTCGTPVEKMWLKCKSCREKIADDKWASAEKKPYDGGIVYSDYLDRYFTDIDELEDYLFNLDDDLELSPKKLRLYHCDPTYLSHIDSEHWADIYPGEEHDEPDGVEDLLKNINALITIFNKRNGPVSWNPSNVAIEPM